MKNIVTTVIAKTDRAVKARGRLVERFSNKVIVPKHIVGKTLTRNKVQTLYAAILHDEITLQVTLELCGSSGDGR